MTIPGSARKSFSGTATDPNRRGLRSRLPGPDSMWWIAAVAVAFTLVQLVTTPLRLGLSWDEVVYVSQASAHAPAAFFDPARARGIPVLVAPVALLTSSIIALRVYLAIVSGLALFGSLLTWRPFRPAWVLALAGLAFGSLWVALFYGPQAMPDEWMAFAALAAVGLFLRVVGPASSGAVSDPPESAANRRLSPRGALALLAAVIAAGALTRPGDAVFLVAALLVAALAVRQWRRWPVIVAIGAGFVAGSAEWISEAYARFGGPLSRLHLASAEQGGFGLHFGAWAELRAANGPTLCRPCLVGWRYPELGLWWLALPVLVVLGVLVARQAGRIGALLAALCGLALASQYLIGVDYAAPRFLLPAYLLAAIPVADLLAWLLVKAETAQRPELTGLVMIVLGVQILAQQVVLHRQVADTMTLHTQYANAAADLRKLGVQPPCLLNGAQRIPISFYMGCASTPESLGNRPPNVPMLRHGLPGRFAILELGRGRPPLYARSWPSVRLAGTGRLALVAYLPPR